MRHLVPPNRPVAGPMRTANAQRNKNMKVTAQNAVDAFDAIGDVSCHNKVLTARLKQAFNANDVEAATAIHAAIDTKMLQLSSIGFITKL